MLTVEVIRVPKGEWTDPEMWRIHIRNGTVWGGDVAFVFDKDEAEDKAILIREDIGAKLMDTERN